MIMSSRFILFIIYSLFLHKCYFTIWSTSLSSKIITEISTSTRPSLKIWEQFFLFQISAGQYWVLGAVSRTNSTENFRSLHVMREEKHREGERARARAVREPRHAQPLSSDAARRLTAFHFTVAVESRDERRADCNSDNLIY